MTLYNKVLYVNAITLTLTNAIMLTLVNAIVNISQNEKLNTFF